MEITDLVKDKNGNYINMQDYLARDLVQSHIQYASEEDREVIKDIARIPNTRWGMDMMLELYSKYGQSCVKRVNQSLLDVGKRLKLNYDTLISIVRDEIGGDFSQVEKKEKEFREKWKAVSKPEID